MSPDTPRVVTGAPPPPRPDEAAGSTALAVLMAASGGTITLIWGYETTACAGVIAGAVAAVMRVTFLALTHLPELVLLATVFAVHVGVGHLAARRRPFRGRGELLMLVLPVASFLLGLLIHDTPWFSARCALHPWA